MKRTGFSLIELMIAVTIVGILAAIVYPSYQKHIESGHRLTAQRILLEQATLLERQYSRQGNYPDTFAIGSTAHYDFTYQRTAQQLDAFTLTATPKAKQSLCGKLTLNHQGITTAERNQTQCWSE